MSVSNNTTWDTSYEWKAVALLGLGFGLVGLERWIITPLFPSMIEDLGLSYQDLGTIVGSLGLMWGIFAIFSGRLADMIGHRKILIPSIIIFSLMSGFSGWAGGLVSLIFIRSIMGVAEGAFCPTSFAATAAAAKPERLGALQGLQQSGFALFGLGLGPIIATQLLLVVPSWREVFWVVAIPGFIIAVLMYFVLKDPKDLPHSRVVQQNSGEDSGKWKEIFASRNIIISMFALFAVMGCVFVLSALLPSYMTDFLKLNPQQMGGVMSAIGFGGFLGQFAVPAISDRLGRKPTVIFSFIANAAAVWVFAQLGSETTTLFIALFFLSFFALGNIALITGPIATEAAPLGLTASAIGLVIGAGEIFGGGIAPFIGGYVAQNYGIENVLYFALVSASLGAVFCLFLTETSPSSEVP